MNRKLNHIQNWPGLAVETKWSVQNLAKYCGVSVRILERHFYQAFGQSPKAWLIAQRHKQAAEMLHDHTTVKETASLIGYAYASTFAREFKKKTGHRPSHVAKLPP